MSLADRLPGRHRARTLRPLVIGDAALGVGPIVARDARFVKWPSVMALRRCGVWTPVHVRLATAVGSLAMTKHVRGSRLLSGVDRAGPPIRCVRLPSKPGFLSQGPGLRIQIPTIERIAMRGPRAGGLIPLASSSRITRAR